jgi:hypothetical protein
LYGGILALLAVLALGRHHFLRPAELVSVNISYAPEGKQLKMPWHQQWLNSDDSRTARFAGTPVSSACVSLSDCTPDFVIAGSGHSGSTSLYALLMQHPQLIPAAVKEVNFLGLDAHWLNRSRYAQALFPFKTGGPQKGQLLGEASPFYFSNPVAPAQLRYLAPKAKIILILRAPPDHCWSASAASVMRAVNLSQSGRRGGGGGDGGGGGGSGARGGSESGGNGGGSESGGDGGGSGRGGGIGRGGGGGGGGGSVGGAGVSTGSVGPSGLEAGICRLIERKIPSRVLADYFPCDPHKGFAPSLARWLDYFGPRRVLILLLEALRRDPAAQAARAWRFLGLAPYRIPLPQQTRTLELARSAHAKTRMPVHVRRMLEACLAEPTRALERLMASRLSANNAPRLRSFASWRSVLTAKTAAWTHEATVGVGGGSADHWEASPAAAAAATAPPPSRVGAVNVQPPSDGSVNVQPLHLDAAMLPPPRVGVVMHTYGRPASPAQSAVADNVACYCAATRACTLFYAHTEREGSDALGTAVQLPWYDEPVIIGDIQNSSTGATQYSSTRANQYSSTSATRYSSTAQNGSTIIGHVGGQVAPVRTEATAAGARRLPVNRPGWPLHQFAKLVRLARAWEQEGSPDWLWYIDGDVRVLNYSVRIDDFLPPECKAPPKRRGWWWRAWGRRKALREPHVEAWAGRQGSCDEVGLVVVDHPWAGIVAGSFLVRRSTVGLDILRHIWECQLFAPKLGDQAGLADAILTRTQPRNGASPYPAHECISSPLWRHGGWRGVTQCWNFHMARMEHPYGDRSTSGVRYLDPRGPDLQAFSFHNYGERTPDQLEQAYGSNPALDPSLQVHLPLSTSRNDAIFQRGDLLVHSSMLGGARMTTPDLLDAVGALPGLDLRAKPRARNYNYRHLKASEAVAAISACLRGPTVTYARRPLLAERPTKRVGEVFVLRRMACPDSGANVCPRPAGANGSPGKKSSKKKKKPPRP